MLNRGNHSIEYCELEKGMHELNYNVYGFEPPQRLDEINPHYYEPQGGVITCLKIGNEFLTGVLRGFMPRWDMPIFEKNMQKPRWGWQGILDRVVAKGAVSEKDVNRKFGIILATDVNPNMIVERSEDKHADV